MRKPVNIPGLNFSGVEMDYRTEKDMLGQMDVPAEYYYGIHTARAVNNFNIAGRQTEPALLKAVALVKKACAQANRELNYLPDDKAAVICQACDDVIEGHLASHFPVDALQGGALRHAGRVSRLGGAGGAERPGRGHGATDTHGHTRTHTDREWRA